VIAQSEQQTDDRREGEHHDHVVQRDLAKREMRLAIGQVAPYEHHRGARRRGEDDQTGDVAVDLIRRQIGRKQVSEEEPGERRHRERLDRPVDEKGDTDAAPVLAHLAERAEVDLEQHRDDHQPDQDRDRQVDAGDLHAADRLKHAGEELAERDACRDAKRDPQGQKSFEHRHGFVFLSYSAAARAAG
jgi:hypothetical protein